MKSNILQSVGRLPRANVNRAVFDRVGWEASSTVGQQPHGK